MPQAICQNCGHPFYQHGIGGCNAGWVAEDDGDTEQPCECTWQRPMSLSDALELDAAKLRAMGQDDGPTFDNGLHTD